MPCFRSAPAVTRWSARGAPSPTCSWSIKSCRTAGAWECIAPPHDADEILLKIGAYVHAKLDADRARSEGLLDSATRLYNRQGLARRARELGAQAYRDHGALACVVFALDIDPSGPGTSP